MNLNRTLSIDGVTYNSIDERIVLDLNTPSRAEFTLLNSDIDIKVNQLVTFDFGYATQTNLQRFFIGFIEKVQPVNKQITRVFCRELAAVLSRNLPISLRHVTLREVLSYMSKKTSLEFVTPNQSYATNKVAHFTNLGTGFMAMYRLASLFNIEDFIWQQQGDGIIFVGNWEHSQWAKKTEFKVPDDMFDQHTAQQSARIVAIPQLRPGQIINDKRIQTIEFNKSHMKLSWGKV